MTQENNRMAEIPVTEPARQKYFMKLVREQVAALSQKKGRPLTCFISTFGCRLNIMEGIV